MKNTKKLVALAATAHPDDIEFAFAGTLALLRESGCEIHMWNLADGCCGSTEHEPAPLAEIRGREAARSAALAGAQIHPPLFPDLEVFYDKVSLQAVAAVLRSIRPQIVLTHAPRDYMEDHQNVCRLITTAAFCHITGNFRTEPETPPFPDPVRVYHTALPHPFFETPEAPIEPDFRIDVGSKMDLKRQMLDCHESQKRWLEKTASMSSMTAAMDERCLNPDFPNRGPQYCESWRTHSYRGFCDRSFDPLPELLKPFLVAP